MNFLSEIKSRQIANVNVIPNIHCKIIEDNSGALELARVPKMRPRKKHISVEMHHFRSYVRDKLMHIYPIRSEDQPADILSKAVEFNTFVKHRKFLLGW
jgi:hypothetical protein